MIQFNGRLMGNMMKTLAHCSLKPHIRDFSFPAAVRAGFVLCAGVVLVGCCNKAKSRAITSTENRKKNLHGEFVRHRNTCALDKSRPKNPVASFGLLFVALASRDCESSNNSALLSREKLEIFLTLLYKSRWVAH